MTKLIWNALVEDWNNKILRSFNVFYNPDILSGLSRIKKTYKKDLKEYTEKLDKFQSAAKVNKWKEKYKKEVFSELIKGLFMWQYWGRCEYEIGYTNWPCSIRKEELLSQLAENVNRDVWKDDGVEHDTKLLYINPAIYEKVSVFEQLQLNWDRFIDYVWNNMEYIEE